MGEREAKVLLDARRSTRRDMITVLAHLRQPAYRSACRRSSNRMASDPDNTTRPCSAGRPAAQVAVPEAVEVDSRPPVSGMRDVGHAFPSSTPSATEPDEPDTAPGVRPPWRTWFDVAFRGADPASQSTIEACTQLGLSRGELVGLDARDEDMPRGNDDSRLDHRKRSPWRAEVDGFSVHEVCACSREMLPDANGSCAIVAALRSASSVCLCWMMGVSRIA
jgi:hypothetical protein